MDREIEHESTKLQRMYDALLDFEHFGRIEIAPTQLGLVQTLEKARKLLAELAK